MGTDIATKVRAAVQAALAAQPFRGAPSFDDVEAAAVASALHVVQTIGAGDGAEKAASLEKQLRALQSVTDAQEATLREAVARIAALEAIGASQRQASQVSIEMATTRQDDLKASMAEAEKGIVDAEKNKG